MRRKTVSQETNQFSSLIIIDQSPQVSSKVHNLSLLVDATTHIVEDDENTEDDIFLSTFVSKLRKRKTTLNIVKYKQRVMKMKKSSI